jgi:hypothetical protein
MARDLRKFANRTNLYLVAGFISLLLVVGVGLIYLIYGAGAAVTGLICILAGIAPVILIAGALLLMDVIARKANDG